MAEKKMLAAAYCRVSTKDEEQLKSFEHQKQYFSEMFEGSEEYELYRIYADKGKTGTKIDRPDFNDMIKDAGIDKSRVEKGYFVITGKPKFKMILVKNTSRFARHDATPMLLQSLLNNGVDVKFIDTNTRASDQNAVVTLGLMGVVDKAESKDKSRKTLFGMRQGAKNGNILCTNKIYGYKYYPMPANRLEIIPEQAEIVKRIFEMYADGIGAHRIAKILHDEGIKNKSKEPFKEYSIRRILTNEKYCGIVARMKYDTGEVFNKHSYARVVPLEEREEYQFEDAERMPAIISKELFYKAQAMKEGRIQHANQVGKKKALNYGTSPYARKVYCASCGKQYRLQTTKQYGDRKERYFCCVGKMENHFNDKKCTNPNVSETFLNNDLKEQYAERFADSFVTAQRLLAELKPILIADINNRNAKKELAQLKAEQEECTAKLSRANKALIDGNEGIFDEIIKPLSEQNKKLTARINELSKSREEKEDDLLSVYETMDELKSRLSELFELEMITGYEFDGDTIVATESENTDGYGVYHADYNLPPKKQFTLDEILSNIDRITVNRGKVLTIKFKAFTEVEKLLERHERIMPERILKIYDELRTMGWNRLLCYEHRDFWMY